MDVSPSHDPLANRPLTLRPRLIELTDALFEQHTTVLVVAGPGTGKSRLGEHYAAHVGFAHRWLDLRTVSLVPLEFVAHLADQPAGVTSGHDDLIERAASAAESLGNEPALIVLDGAQVLGLHDGTLEVLATFIEYLPPLARMLILSDDELGGPIARLALKDRLGRLTDEDLALTASEADEIASRHPLIDGADLLHRSGGWVAVAHLLAKAPADPAASIGRFVDERLRSALTDEEWSLLRAASVAPQVGPSIVAALVGEGALPIFERLRARHMPWRRLSTGELVYHPFLREHLRAVLEQEAPEEAALLRLRLAEHLARTGSFIDATEHYLALGRQDDATVTAEAVIASLLERADWTTIARWLQQLGPRKVDASPRLVAARVRLLYATREFIRARDLVRELTSGGRMAEVVEADPGVVAYLGLVHHWQPHIALEILENHLGDFRAQALRYELLVLTAQEPVVPPAGVEWSDMERIMSWGLLLQGRIDQLLRMLESHDGRLSSAFGRTPHPLLGLVWRGDIAQARRLFEQVPDRQWGGFHADLWHFHNAWLHWAEGKPDATLHSAEEAVARARATRSGAEPCFQVIEACALIELGSLEGARATLERSRQQSLAHGLAAYVEWAETFLGLVELAESRPFEARQVLDRTVASMRAADRRLLLPLALAYLSEALALVGETEGAATTAEEAFDEAARMRSQFALQRALSHVPGVLNRQIERNPHSRWRELLHAQADEKVRTTAVVQAVEGRHTFVEVRTFGDDPDIIVDGRPVGLRRIKVLELATLLTLHPHGIDRAELQARLFPDADQKRGGNYFRQVVHKLRQVTGIGLLRGGDGLVRWAERVHVETTDTRIESLVAQAGEQSGTDRLETLCTALSLFTGSFLPDSDLEWAEARRAEFDIKRSALALDAANLALELGFSGRARDISTDAIAADPFLEQAYRVLMIAESRLGSQNVLAVYQRLVAALDQLGVHPDAESEQLLEDLRR